MGAGRAWACLVGRANPHPGRRIGRPGLLYALMEHDMKRLLAYHSVENIGIILIGVGVSMIFMASGHPDLAAFGLIAGLYHTINHAIFKSLLFMGAGSIIYSTHTRNIEEYGLSLI